MFGEEDDAGSGSAQPVDRVCVGDLLLHQAQEGVFHETAAGEGGLPARFVDGQQMRVIKRLSEQFRRPTYLRSIDSGLCVRSLGSPPEDQ